MMKGRDAEAELLLPDIVARRANFEARIPKSETIPKYQRRNDRNAVASSAFAFSNFGFVSDFALRNSDLVAAGQQGTGTHEGGLCQSTDGPEVEGVCGAAPGVGGRRQEATPRGVGRLDSKQVVERRAVTPASVPPVSGHQSCTPRRRGNTDLESAHKTCDYLSLQFNSASGVQRTHD